MTATSGGCGDGSELPCYRIKESTRSPDERKRHPGFPLDPHIAPLMRATAKAPDPESRDSGFDASHRPGMTAGENRHAGQRGYVAPNGEFVVPHQADATCPVPSQKINPFAFTPNHIHISACPVPTRGGSRSSRTRDGMRWTRRRRKTSGADPPSLKLRRTGTKTVAWLFRKAGADGKVVWS
jgi:hypothetical protein